jgi:hypothetical protein
VLGLSYSGHSVDWFFVGVFATATVFWFVRTWARPSPRLVGRLMVGAVVALIAVVAPQSINNALFDPLFRTR